jgi:hypothetical protein
VLVTVAVSEVELPYVVASGVAPQFTAELAAKFVPVTVSVKVVAPATAEVGLSDVIAGPSTVKVLAEDTPVGLCTVTLCSPALASCVLVTAAVRDVALP